MVNVTNIVENKTADIKISTVDYLDKPVPQVQVKLGGGRKLGTKFVSPYDPVYSVDFDGKTDSNGEKEFNSVSPGSYTFSLSDDALSTYALIGIDPVSPLTVVPDSTVDVKIKVADKNTTGLLVKVFNDSSKKPLSGATVKLESTDLAYDETVTVGDDGMAFFPVTDATVFQAGTYTLTVKATNFQDDTKSVTISDGHLSQEDVSMIAS